MALSFTALEQFVYQVVTTRSDEIGCVACYVQVERYIEHISWSEPLGEDMPLVRDHLEHCIDCREEVAALEAALSGSRRQPRD
jgi:hypothetical protein